MSHFNLGSDNRGDRKLLSLRNWRLTAGCLFFWAWLFGAAGFTYGQVRYHVANGTATVTGYSGTVPSSITIPSTYTTGGVTYPVTAIGAYAFRWSHNLRYVSLGDNLLDIGEGAFRSCYYLGSLALPSRLRSIGQFAFADSTSIGRLTIPANVSSIGVGAFLGISSITVAPGNPYFETRNGVLFNEAGTVLIYFPGALETNTGTYAIPEGVVRLEQYAFPSPRVSTLSLPSTLTDIGEFPFSGSGHLSSFEVSAANPAYASKDGVLFDKGLATVLRYPQKKSGSYVIPESVTTLGPGAFDSCSGLTSVRLPSGIRHIPAACFNYCESLSTVVVPDGVVDIGGWAFYGCMQLAKVELPEGLASIGSSAFHFCTILPDLRIPASVATIGDNAFSNCYKLTQIRFAGNAPSATTPATNPLGPPPTASFLSGSTGFTTPTWRGLPSVQADPSLAPLAATDDASLPRDDKLTLRATVNPNGSATSVIFEYGPTLDFGFAKPAAMSPVNGVSPVSVSLELNTYPIPGEMYFRVVASNANGISTGLPKRFATGIRSGDFIYATAAGLAVITGYKGAGGMVDIPPMLDGCAVVRIGTGAFSGATGIAGVVVPAGVTEIAYAAFSGCTNLAGITLPAGLTLIGVSAFSDCANLAGVSIPASVAEIGNFAFASCRGLTAINMDAANPFFTCADGVLYDKGMTRLIQYPGGKSGAFSIPASVTEIGMTAFADCAGLTEVVVPGSVRDLGAGAFMNCERLARAVIHDGITAIPSNSFSNCTELVEVRLPATLTKIESSAFSNCSRLSSLALPASLASLGSSCFTGCLRLEQVLFEGNAPNPANYPFDGNAPGPTLFCRAGATGFSFPTWAQRPTVRLGNPAIWIQPMAATVLEGTSVRLQVSAVGSGPLSYQWFEGMPGDTAAPVGGDSPEFSSPALQSDTRYWVRVSSSADSASVDSSVAEIAVTGRFNQWIAGFPAIPVEQRGVADDPDHDGINNGGEFVFGGDPTNNTEPEGVRPRYLIDYGPAWSAPFYRYFHYSHRRSTASVAAGVEAVCEISESLSGNWTEALATGAAFMTVTPGPRGPGGYDTVDYYVSLWGPASTFVRLRITTP